MSNEDRDIKEQLENFNPPKTSIFIYHAVRLFVSFSIMFFFLALAQYVGYLGLNIIWGVLVAGTITFLALRAMAKWSEPTPAPAIAKATLLTGVAWPLLVFIGSYIKYNEEIKYLNYHESIIYKIGIIGLVVPIILAISGRIFTMGAGGLRTTAIGVMAAFLTDCAALLLTLGSETGGSRSCGRPYRVRDKQSLAKLNAETSWSSLHVSVALPEEPMLREALGQAWLQDARSEHASIAAFARLTQQLLAAGAPPELLTQVSQAAADEVRHAEICFSLARHYLGRAVGASKFPEALDVRAAACKPDALLTQLAVEALLDGCLNEGWAAAEASRAASGAADPAIRSLLQAIAIDEDRHAELGWTILEWTLQVDTEQVAPSLVSAMAACPKTVPFVDLTVLPSAEHHLYGRLGAGEREATYVQTRVRVQARLRGLLSAALKRSPVSTGLTYLSLTTP